MIVVFVKQSVPLVLLPKTVLSKDYICPNDAFGETQHKVQQNYSLLSRVYRCAGNGRSPYLLVRGKPNPKSHPRPLRQTNALPQTRAPRACPPKACQPLFLGGPPYPHATVTSIIPGVVRNQNGCIFRTVSRNTNPYQAVQWTLGKPKGTGRCFGQ